MHAPLAIFRAIPATIANFMHLATYTVALTCAVPAFAQEPPGKDDSEDSSWGLGVAVVSGQDAYKDRDRETKALPMFSYENQYVKLSGPNLELKLPGVELDESQRLNFGVVAKLFEGGGYEAGDSPALVGMAERKSSTWVGAKAEWENELADVKFEMLGDASGKSKGVRVALGVEHKWMLNPNMMLIPQAGVEWVDKKYVDYYYGVRASEAIVGRPEYKGKGTVNAEIGLAGIYRFDKQHSMMLNVGVKSLGDEIKNSPIVDRSTENHVMLGYMYRF